MKKTILVIALLQCVSGISYADDFTDAKVAYDNGQFNKSVSLYSKACKNKNGKACMQLGWLYDNGLGVQQDPFKSVDLYTKGCNYGDGMSCNLIGQMYYQGRIVGNDDMKALGFFKKGCALNDSWACVGVTNVEDKHGIYNKSNVSKAYSLSGFNKNNDDVIKNKISLCNNGNIDECLVAGLSYLGGKEGFPKDRNKAIYFSSKACNSNEPIKNAHGCILVSSIYANIEKDIQKSKLFFNKAVEKFTSACEDGNSKGCLVIAGMYKEDTVLSGIELLKKDMKKSNLYYQKACDLGEEKGCMNLPPVTNKNNTTEAKTLEGKKVVNETECDLVGGKWQWNNAIHDMQCL
jgi:uncharacterized protein